MIFSRGYPNHEYFTFYKATEIEKKSGLMESVKKQKRKGLSMEENEKKTYFQNERT